MFRSMLSRSRRRPDHMAEIVADKAARQGGFDVADEAQRLSELTGIPEPRIARFLTRAAIRARVPIRSGRRVVLARSDVH